MKPELSLAACCSRNAGNTEVESRRVYASATYWLRLPAPKHDHAAAVVYSDRRKSTRWLAEVSLIVNRQGDFRRTRVLLLRRLLPASIILSLAVSYPRPTIYGAATSGVNFEVAGQDRFHRFAFTSWRSWRLPGARLGVFRHAIRYFALFRFNARFSGRERPMLPGRYTPWRGTRTE